jgi:signal transduction histidine kinase/CheY-like chemotaxis protein
MLYTDRLTSLLPHRSLRARFAWVTGLSGVLFAVVLAFLVAQDQRGRLQQAVSASVKREARVMGQIMSSALAERQSQIQQVASLPEVASGLMDAGSMRLLLERIRSYHTEFEWLAMVDAKGLITTATGARLEGQDVSEQPWFIQGLKAAWIGQPQWAGPLTPYLPLDQDGRPAQLIDIAVPVLDYEGQTIGVIVGMLNWRWIRQMHATLVASEGSLAQTLLQTPQGEVLIGPQALLGEKMRPPGLEALLASGSVDLILWPDIGTRLTATAPMTWSVPQQNAQPWIMVMRQDPRQVFGPAEALWQRMLAGGLLASALFMLLSWWLAGRVSRPLRELARNATALREGKATQFEVQHDSADEIAALSRSLNDMHGQLQARMAELAAYRDQLETKIAERTEQLRQARDKAEAATRAKSAFIANMSHEIRTPMNAIMGMTYLMQQSPVLPGQAERMRAVQQAAEHLLDIINNVLDLSKIEAGMFSLCEEDFHLPTLIEQATGLLADAARAKQITLHVESEGCPEQLRGDPTRLSQVLINLLSNAVKFTERGDVRLAVRAKAQNDKRTLLQIEVHDTGVGIPAEKIDKLFNAFVQADDSTTRRFGGTGLGLAITRSLIDLMGGQMGVVSEEGKGSVFWCTVPFRPALDALAGIASANYLPSVVPDGDSPLPAEPPQDVLRRLHSGSKVLLAEDNAINALLAMELLNMAGLTPILVKTGLEAVERCRNHEFDLVLMDVHMPEMDGLVATRTIRQMGRHKDLPIIAMTASVLQDEREACMAAGMNGHLAKPIDTNALYGTLLYWLERRRAVHQASSAGANVSV